MNHVFFSETKFQRDNREQKISSCREFWIVDGVSLFDWLVKQKPNIYVVITIHSASHIVVVPYEK